MDAGSFLGLFVLFGCAIASPISAPSDSNGQTASVIYVVLAVLIFLAVLAIVKYFYMKNRRVKCGHIFSKTSSSYYDPFSLDSYCRTSLDASKESMHKESSGDKTGFFVGLLGSPAWETKIKLEADAAAWRHHQNSSFTYHLHTQSRQRSSQPYQPQWKSPSVSPPTASRAGSAEGPRSMRLSRSSSLNLPKLPERSHDPPLRRLSLPARGRKFSTSSETPTGSVSGKRSRSSSRSGRNRSLRGLKISKASISNGASPSLSRETDATSVPLSRSPIFSPSSSPLFLSNPFPPNFKSRTSRKPISPLPSLPVSDPFSSAANPSSIGIPLPSRTEISRPFTLLSKTNDTILKPSQHDPMKGRSRDSYLYQELLPVLKPLDVYSSVPETNQHTTSKPYDVPPVTRQALASITHPINCAPGSCAPPSLQTSPPLFAVPIFAQKAVHPKPRSKQKSKNDVQSRGRKSSSLGPSPLRAMILPDSSSGSDVGSPRPDNNEKENQPTPTADQYSCSNTVSHKSGARSSGLGEFGELSGKYSSLRTVDEEFGSQSDLESLRASMNAEKASKLLLSMAREHERAEDGTMLQNDTSKSTASRSRSWEPSKEVDLGLIGLNLFIGDSDLDENIGGKDDSEIDFVSFWEEAKLLEEEEKRRESVGLAW